MAKEFFRLSLIVATIVVCEGCRPTAPAEPVKDSAEMVSPKDEAFLRRMESKSRQSTQLSTSDIESLEQLRLRYPAEISIVDMLVEAYQSRGDWGRVESAWAGLPEELRNTESYAQSLFMNEKHEELIGLLLPIVGQASAPVWSLYLIANSLDRLGKYDEAMFFVERLTDVAVGQSKASARILKGRICVNLRRFQEAKLSYEQALEAVPDDVAAISGLVNVLGLLGENGQAARMADRLQQVKNKLGKTEDQRALYRVLQFSLEAQIREGSFEEARKTILRMTPLADEHQRRNLIGYLNEIEARSRLQ